MLISVAKYITNPSILRLEIIYSYFPIGEGFSTYDLFIKKEITLEGQNHRFPELYPDTWLFDLKEDGTLYIMRGLHRHDNDLSKKWMMIFLNRCYVIKLGKKQFDQVIGLAQSVQENQESLTEESYPPDIPYNEFSGNVFSSSYLSDLDSYLWFNQDTLYYPYKPSVYDRIELNAMEQLQIMLTKELSPIKLTFQTWL